MIGVEFNEAEARFLTDLLGKMTPAWLEVLGVGDPPGAGTYGVAPSLSAYVKMRTAVGDDRPAGESVQP